MSNSIDWHSKIAEQFDARYRKNSAFQERYLVWKTFIDCYSHPENRVLDVGCGSGQLALLAAEHNREVIAIDGSLEMLEICHQKRVKYDVKNVQFIQVKLETSDLTILGGFELIICSSILEYLDNFSETLLTLSNCLTAHGVFIFSIPNGASFYRKLERFLFKLTGFPRYYAHVRHVLNLAEANTKVNHINMQISKNAYYAPTPFFSPLARYLKHPEWADNLLLVVCQRLASSSK